MAPQVEVDPSTFKGTTIVTENKSIAHESMTNTTADQLSSLVVSPVLSKTLFSISITALFLPMKAF